MGRLELMTGSPRSGKSALAEKRVVALSGHGPRLYVATLPPMACYADRIAEHRRRRDDAWRVVEIRRDLFLETASRLAELGGWRVVLLDGISNYLARLVDRMQAQRSAPAAEEALVARCAGAVRALRERTDCLVVVGTIAEPRARDAWQESLVHWNSGLLEMLASEADQAIVVEGKVW